MQAGEFTDVADVYNKNNVPSSTLRITLTTV